MDPWIAFDEARACWDVEHTRRARLRILHRMAKQDLLTHVFAFVSTNVPVWGIWFASGAGPLWPMLLTAPWSIALAINVLRFRSLSHADAPQVPEPSAVSTYGGA